MSNAVEDLSPVEAYDEELQELADAEPQVHGLILGGYTVPKAMLERVGEAMINLGMVYDFDAITMRGSLGSQDSQVERIAKGAHVGTHSAGMLGAPEHVHMAALSVYAGPEPRSLFHLYRSAGEKMLDYLVMHPTAERLKVLSGNAQDFAIHPWGNGSKLWQISKFSTIGALTGGDYQADSIGHYSMRNDVFFGRTHPDDMEYMRSFGRIAEELEGDHDELLMNPEKLLKVAKDLQPTHRA